MSMSHGHWTSRGLSWTMTIHEIDNLHHDHQEEEEASGNRPKSIKEMEEEKAAEKAAQQK